MRAFFFLCLLLVAAVPPGVRAQSTAFRTVEENGDGLLIEITVDWPFGLKAAVDSAAAAGLTPVAARALAGGQALLSETYRLPALALPAARLVASDYDELSLPPGPGADSVLADLALDPVSVVGLGRMRGDPVATLVVRPLGYDAATGTLRRYRRLVVALDYRASGRQAAGPSMRLAGESGAGNPHLGVTESVLSEGTIFKVPVSREGVYRIDRAFLAALGLSPGQIDPEHVRVYGNGGAPLPALNAAPRPAGLVENPVLRRGGGDGSFDAGDEVLFFGAAPRGWRYDAERGWEHYVNPFSSDNFYFIKIDDEDGLSVGAGSFPGFTDARRLTQVTGRFFRDIDEFNWSRPHTDDGSGLTWVSRTIGAGGAVTVLSDASLPGLAAGTVRYEARAAVQSSRTVQLAYDAAGQRLAEVTVPGRPWEGTEYPIAYPMTTTFSQDVAAGARLGLAFRLQAQGAAASAAVDWVRVLYPQELRAAGDTLRFATPGGETGRFEFVLRGFGAEPQVWDVTEPGAVRRLGVRAAGDGYLVQVEVTDVARPREIVAFGGQAVRSLVAERAAAVPNQNLHGLGGYPDLAVVTSAALAAPAEELAEYRRGDGLEVVVARVDQIYNEFSGGVPDMRAVRDYFKFLYDRAPDDARRLRYALLFGDGHYNFRGLGGEAQRPELANHVPPYETVDSFDPTTSYSSDDYFGLLDDEEGEWRWGSIYTPAPSGAVVERVDLGVGRIPAQTAEEAAAVVRKIKHYESPATYGPWRLRYAFLADDALTGSGGGVDEGDLHTQNADVVAELVKREHPAINVEKIYGVSYTREFRGDWRLPEMEGDILEAIDEGVLLLNYSGHGGEEGLAQEDVFTREVAAELENLDRLPVFVTATCSFGWWDLSREQSGAEVLLLNPNGGAVALLTTVRLVYTSSSLESLNVGLNRALNKALFERDQDGLPRRLGDVMRITKNTAAGLQGNNRKFNLLGDPTMRLGLPARSVEIETVGGTPVAEQPPIRALDRTSVTGYVRHVDGSIDASFDGTAHVTVFDAARRVDLPVPQTSMPTPYYEVREDLIWRGSVPVTDGRFTVRFVVPKDISYSNRPGRIVAYAANDAAQAGGFTENVVVGGTSASPPDDAEGPEIALFLNDTTFVSGGMTPADPRLIVKLRDASGINTVGAGVGHEMLLVVDGDEQHAVDLSDRFESEPGSFERGTVTFSFNEYPVELAPGPHALTLRAWDVLNNSATERLDFYVSTTEELVVRNVFNYPNPTSGHTRFVFEHNQPSGTPAEVQVRIYTLSGRPIRTIEAVEALPAGMLTSGPVQVPWDGLDEDFDPVATGVYLYKVRIAVEGPDGERRVSEHIEKLAVIR